MLGVCIPTPPKSQHPKNDATNQLPTMWIGHTFNCPTPHPTSFATLLPSLLLMFLMDPCTTHRGIRGIPQRQVARHLLQEARSVATCEVGKMGKIETFKPSIIGKMVLPLEMVTIKAMTRLLTGTTIFPMIQTLQTWKDGNVSKKNEEINDLHSKLSTISIFQLLLNSCYLIEKTSTK